MPAWNHESRSLGNDADRAGAPAATECSVELLTAEQPRLRRLIHRLLGWPAGSSEVDDVLQETLLAAWRHRDSFRGHAGVSTWLHRIAVNKTNSHTRAQRRRRRFFGWLGLVTEPVAAAGPLGGPCDGDTRLDATHAAMQRLSHQDREVLVLRYLEQRDVTEVGELLGCSRAAVDARLSRARNRLRELLDLQERDA